MLSTIVIPLLEPRLDPSGTGECALPYARALAADTRASVVLVSVIEVPRSFRALIGTLNLDLAEEERRWIAERTDYLRRVAETFPGTQVDIVVKIGDPVSDVIETLAGFPDPLLIVGTHARAGVARIVYGSVAARLVHDAPTPVVVVPPHCGEPAGWMPGPVRKILVPLDGSAFGEEALQCALATLGVREMDIRLLHVIEPDSGYNPDLAAARLQAEREWATHYLVDVAGRLGEAGWHAETIVRESQAVAPEIAAVARELGSDLIVMATHGRGGLSRVVFGSVAEEVLSEAPVPLFLVRPKGKKTAGAGSQAASS